jgi:hypothetical protein
MCDDFDISIALYSLSSFSINFPLISSFDFSRLRIYERTSLISFFRPSIWKLSYLYSLLCRLLASSFRSSISELKCFSFNETLLKLNSPDCSFDWGPTMMDGVELQLFWVCFRLLELICFSGGFEELPAIEPTRKLITFISL